MCILAWIVSHVPLAVALRQWAPQPTTDASVYISTEEEEDVGGCPTTSDLFGTTIACVSLFTLVMGWLGPKIVELSNGFLNAIAKVSCVGGL